VKINFPEGDLYRLIPHFENIILSLFQRNWDSRLHKVYLNFNNYEELVLSEYIFNNDELVIKINKDWVEITLYSNEKKEPLFKIVVTKNKITYLEYITGDFKILQVIKKSEVKNFSVVCEEYIDSLFGSLLDSIRHSINQRNIKNTLFELEVEKTWFTDPINVYLPIRKDGRNLILKPNIAKNYQTNWQTKDFSITNHLYLQIKHVCFVGSDIEEIKSLTKMLYLNNKGDVEYKKIQLKHNIAVKGMNDKKSLVNPPYLRELSSDYFNPMKPMVIFRPFFSYEFNHFSKPSKPSKPK
jgi:hypothetical protein